MPSRPIKILPQFLCGSLFCAPRCAKGCEHKINIITLFYRNNSKISIVYTCFLQYIQRLYSRQRIDIRAFLTVGAFLQNLGALILGKFCVLTKRGFEAILDVTPQLSLCGVALDEAGKRTLKDPFFLRARKRVCHRILHSATDPLFILLLYLPFIF